MVNVDLITFVYIHPPSWGLSLIYTSVNMGNHARNNPFIQYQDKFTIPVCLSYFWYKVTKNERYILKSLGLKILL